MKQFQTGDCILTNTDDWVDALDPDDYKILGITLKKLSGDAWMVLVTNDGQLEHHIIHPDWLKSVTPQQSPVPPCSSCTRFGPNPVGRCPECGV